MKPLPCVHCGSAAPIHVDYSVDCMKCGAMMYADIDGENAIEKWNALRGRGVPEMVAALEEIVSNCRIFYAESMDIEGYATEAARAALAKWRGE